MKWILSEVQPIINLLNKEVLKFNYHAGIIGSVITNGESENDLDIIFLPYENNIEIDTEGLKEYLISIGAIEASESLEYVGLERKVYKSVIENKPVDFFVY